MAKISQSALAEIRAALEAYKDEVMATPLADSSKRTYIPHAENFVRWLDEDFEPGENGRRRQTRR